MLNFLLARMEDFGLISDRIITGIHHLVISKTSRGSDSVESIVSALYENGNIQSYGSKDRLLLYDVMEHLLRHNLTGKCPLETKN